MKYATVEQVLNYLLLETTEEFESQIDEWIEQTSKEIETITGRIFIADSEVSERVYDGNNTNRLQVDDYIELESVSVNGYEIEAYEYPANKLPKTLLISDSIFSRDRQNVVVNAKWGYSEEVPEDINFACVVMTAGIIQANLAGVNDVKSEKIGEYQITYKDDKSEDIERVKRILSSYKRYSI